MARLVLKLDFIIFVCSLMENVAVDDIVVAVAAVAVVEAVLMKVKMIYQLVDLVVDIVADNY